MSEPQQPESDEDLLEFLGGIDEVNEDSRDADFSDYLAGTDIDKVAGKPREPAKEGKSD